MDSAAHESLKAIRTSFGVTVDEMADLTRKSRATLLRWEKRNTREPMIAGVIPSKNRRLIYLRSLLADYVAALEASDEIEVLGHGSDLFVIAVSRGMLAKYPATRFAVGFCVSKLMRGEGLRSMQEGMPQVEAHLPTVGAMFQWITGHSDGASGIIDASQLVNGCVVHPRVFTAKLRTAQAEDGPPGWRFDSDFVV